MAAFAAAIAQSTTAMEWAIRDWFSPTEKGLQKCATHRTLLEHRTAKAAEADREQRQQAWIGVGSATLRGELWLGECTTHRTSLMHRTARAAEAAGVDGGTDDEEDANRRAHDHGDATRVAFAAILIILVIVTRPCAARALPTNFLTRTLAATVAPGAAAIESEVSLHFNRAAARHGPARGISFILGRDSPHPH